MSTTPIQVPYYDVLIELQDQNRIGLMTKRFQDYLIAVTNALPTYLPLIITGGSGSQNDTAAFQKIINQAAANGGATVVIPPGTYLLDQVTFPAGNAPITLVGQGDSSILKRRSAVPDGTGMLDLLGSNVSFVNFTIDGDVTTPVGLLYNVDFTGIGLNDPMANSLTKNSSIWLHGGTTNFSCQRVKFQHTGGYAALIDAGTAGITDVEFLSCQFQNNRPNLFGITAGDAIYGSWTGGIYVNGDGRSSNPGCVLKGLLISGCKFQRNTGNQIWSHLYGLDELHEDFQILDNYFLDIGLDGVLAGGVAGGAVTGNVLRRIGYTTLTDNDRSYPRWLHNLNATAIDSSGLVKAVIYANNQMLSVNGGSIDMDGHGLSIISANASRIPYPDEPEYAEDQIAVSGQGNAGSTSYGINLGNTSNTPYGAADLNIVGNSLINLRAGAVRLFGARRCLLSQNTILAPADSIYVPIGMGPLGPGPNQRCYNNKVVGNLIDYNPAIPVPCVLEDDTIAPSAPFTGSEANTVCNNVPITPPGTLATEFQKAAGSGSTVYLETVWFT